MYKLYTLFSRYFASFLNIFQTFFFFLPLSQLFAFSPIFSSYLLFFPRKCFYFPRLHTFCILYVSVLTSNPCISFRLIFPRCTTFKETNVQSKQNPRCVSRRKKSRFKFFTITIHHRTTTKRTRFVRSASRSKEKEIDYRARGRAPFRNKCLAAFGQRRKKIERMGGERKTDGNEI